MKVVLIFKKKVFHASEGMSKVVHNLLKACPERCNLRFISNDKNPQFKNSIAVHLDLFFLNKKLSSALKDISPDVIIYIPLSSGTFNSFIRAKVLKIISKKSKVIMLTLQTRYINALFRGILPFLWPDMLFLPSRKAKEALGKTRKVEFFYSGVEVDKFCAVDHKTKENLRKKYGIPVDRFTFLHVGHIKKTRNIGTFLEVIDDNDFAIVVAGGYTGRKENLCGGLLARDNIVYIDSYIENIQEIYQLADCYIFPVESYKGAIDVPLSVLEAMACNIPVITTPFGGLPDKFRENAKKGFLYFDNRLDLERKISLVKGMNPEEIHTRDLVKDFSWGSVADGLVRKIEEYA